MTIPGDTWIKPQEAARLLGCSDRYVRKARDRFVTRAIAGSRGGRGGERYEILLGSLPQAALERWLSEQAARSAAGPSSSEAFAEALVAAMDAPQQPQEDPEAVARAWERAHNLKRRYFDRWNGLLLATEGIRGKRALKSAVDAWNEKHPDRKVSVPSLYRVRKLAQECGRAALLLHEDRRMRSTVKDHWFDWFREAYFHQNRLSAATARMVALGQAIKAGEPVSARSFPSMWAFLRRMEGEILPGIKEHARLGPKAWADRHAYAARRDYSDLLAGRVWVADTRTWDVFVLIDGQATPATAYVTLFLDMKSYAPMGWWIHTSAPATDNTLRAIRHGIERVGLPEDVYVDNGREYRNRDFSGQSRGHLILPEEQAAESLATRLGFRMHFARVRNARAKVIEMQFGLIKNRFDRFWNTFKGGNVLEKPERLKEVLRRGEVPSFEEFRAAADHFLAEVFPRIACHGDHHKGLTRAEILEKDLAASPLPRISRESASWLVTRTERGVIRNDGFRLKSLDCRYWAHWMSARKASKGKPREIVLRYDPEDLRVAWGYETSGELIGECELTHATGALVHPDDQIGKARVQQAIARRKREDKLLKELSPQASAAQLAEMREAYSLAVGAAPLALPTAGPTLLTRHDHDAAELRRQRNEGRHDLSSILAPLEPKTETADELRWYDDAAASAG